MIKGIIFDMDNTLLQSTIDFEVMKQGIVEFIVQNNILSADFEFSEHTSSTLIEHVRALGISADVYTSIMDIATKHELIGMRGAGLEPEAIQLLEQLHGRYTLVVITNNSISAAIEALQNTEIERFFDLIIGREMMSALKPSPSGFHYVMSKFPLINPNEWLSIGDSWIDGKASQAAGISFISYREDANKFLVRGVEPTARISHLMQLYAYVGSNNNL